MSQYIISCSTNLRLLILYQQKQNISLLLLSIFKLSILKAGEICTASKDLKIFEKTRPNIVSIVGAARGNYCHSNL
jgi:hypothetical protein